MPKHTLFIKVIFSENKGVNKVENRYIRSVAAAEL